MSDIRKNSEAPTATEAASESHESFLHRWSRRKHEAHAPPQEKVAPDPDVVEHNAEAAEPALTDADMPPIESLDENSDFSVFMSAGVSEHLRQRALRKLFTLPSINQRCPLDGEWYDCHGYQPLGDVITHEMREAMEREARKLKAAVEETAPEDDPAPSSAAPEAPKSATDALESNHSPARETAPGVTEEKTA